MNSWKDLLRSNIYDTGFDVLEKTLAIEFRPNTRELNLVWIITLEFKEEILDEILSR